jgi:hypothetical protein
MRLESPEWWVNQLKKRDSRKDEHAQIKRGKVTKYCSDDLLVETQENKKRLSDWLDRTTLENKETGDVASVRRGQKSRRKKNIHRPAHKSALKRSQVYGRLTVWMGSIGGMWWHLPR